MDRKRIEEGMRNILGEASPDNSRGIQIRGDHNIVADRSTVIIHNGRRPGERIDDDQLQELRDRVESLAKVDCLIGGARNPEDTRTVKQRHDSARRKRWHAFRDAFHLESYTHLSVGQYEDALAWLDAQKHAALDLLGPPAKNKIKRKSLKRPVRLVTLLLVALAVPLIFSVSRTQPPTYRVTGPIAAIAVPVGSASQAADLLTPTAPLTVVPYQPGFHAHAGCSFFKPAQPIDPMAANRPQDI